MAAEAPDARHDDGLAARIRRRLSLVFIGDWHPVLRDPLDLPSTCASAWRPTA